MSEPRTKEDAGVIVQRAAERAIGDTRVTISAPGLNLPPVETTIEGLQRAASNIGMQADLQRRREDLAKRTRAVEALGETEERERHSVVGLDPHERVKPPLIGSEFGDGPELKAIGEALFAEYEEQFADVRKLRPSVVYLWKRKGGSKQGAVKLLTGDTHHFAKADVEVWIAADFVRTFELYQWQLEALVYHQLCHLSVKKDIDGVVAGLALQGHDIETTAEELDAYGPWLMQHLTDRKMTQLGLFADADEEDDEDDDGGDA